MTARDILIEAMRRRIRLTPDGPRLITESCGDLPPDFEQVLRENKPALLKLLTEKRNTACQILSERDAEWSGMDGKTWHRVNSELSENCLDLLCRRAIDHLRVSQRTNQHHR